MPPWILGILTWSLCYALYFYFGERASGGDGTAIIWYFQMLQFLSNLPLGSYNGYIAVFSMESTFGGSAGNIMQACVYKGMKSTHVLMLKLVVPVLTFALLILIAVTRRLLIKYCPTRTRALPRKS